MTNSEPPEHQRPRPEPTPEPARPETAWPGPGEPLRPSDRIEAADSAFPRPPEPSKAPIIAGVATAIIVLAAMAFFILRDRPQPVAAIPTTTPQAPLTTLAGSTTSVTTTTGNAAAVGYEPRFESGRCRFELITDAEFECGWLTVPEDRQRPDGRQVRIHMARFTSSNPAAPRDPILYLDGGPGGSTLEPLTFTFSQVWEPLLANRDLIFFDQRGVGYSEPSLDCPEERQWAFSVLDQDLTAEQEVTAELDAIRQCRDRLIADGVDLTQYNSKASAADVADLRVALGLEEVNLLGISYGTRLASTVIRDHPEGVRSVILDSSYTPDVDLTAEAPGNFARALKELWDGCELDADCAARYPDLEQRFFALVDEFEAAPTRAPVRDFLNGGSWEVLFDGEWLLGTLFQGLYSDQVIPLLPQMIEELEERDTGTLSLLTSNTLANAEFISLGMMLSVQCHEEIPFTTPEMTAAGLVGFEEIASAFDGASNVGDFMFAACDLWQAGSATPIENEPVTSDVRTLVLAGEYDPITPPAWGASASAYLSNSQFVEFPGLGHGVSISGECPRNIVFAFLDDPNLPVDTRCLTTLPMIDFKIPGERPPELVLVPFTEEVLGTTITGVAPEDWTSVGFGVFARGESAIDQTAILQQVAPFVTPDALVSLLAGQFQMADEPEQVGTADSALGTWRLFLGDADGFLVDIAAIDLGGSSAVIVVVSDPAERDGLADDLLLPAIEAFRTDG